MGDKTMSDKYIIHRFIYENGIPKPSKTELSLSEWNTLQEKHPLWTQFSENMGIGSNSSWYLELSKGQSHTEEFLKINDFLQDYINNYAERNHQNPTKIKCQFINYGKTQLVYVMTDENNNRQTLLVKQPSTRYGAVKQEADILSELKRVDANVICPMEYYSNGEQELYATPYLKQARCIASDDKWGVYVPEPIYRFEEFSKEEADIINTCMIAKLVSYYNISSNEGLSACKLGGGDFVLAKGYEQKAPTIEWIMNNLYLIAGREKLKCSFEEYINIIRDEFSRRTIDDKTTPQINVRGRVPMTMLQIEKGIILGKQLLQQSIANIPDNPNM